MPSRGIACEVTSPRRRGFRDGRRIRGGAALVTLALLCCGVAQDPEVEVRGNMTRFILAYQGARDARRESTDRFRGVVLEAIAFSVVWAVVGAVVVALLGSVLLWGVLLVNAAH